MVPVPYFMEDNVRFTHVAVDVVQGKDMLFHIIFLATGRFSQLCATFSVQSVVMHGNYLCCVCLMCDLKKRHCFLFWQFNW